MNTLALMSTFGRRDGDRSALGALVIALLAVLLIIAILVSIVIGPTGVGLPHLIAYLTGDAAAIDPQNRIILEAVRLPRTGMGLLIGAALGVSGAMMQGLFRNPLADPGIVGVTSGAAFAAVIAIVLGPTLLFPLQAFFGEQFLPMMAFLGGSPTRCSSTRSRRATARPPPPLSFSQALQLPP